MLPYLSPLTVGNLPAISTVAPSQGSTVGNAAGLFPTLAPNPTPGLPKEAGTRPVADTSALPEGASIAGAQVAGLAALALAFILAVARLSIRRSPAKPSQEASTETSAESAGEPDPATTDQPADEQGTEDSGETVPETPSKDGE